MFFLCDRVVNLGTMDSMDDSSPQISRLMRKDGNGAYMLPEKWRENRHTVDSLKRTGGKGFIEPVDWVNGHNPKNLIKEQYMAYGNQAEQAYAYYKECFIVKHGRLDTRERYERPFEDTESDSGDA
ncbi:hypothetical protein BDV98DRAFT_597959 [Pterulicium gracile]|uniref:Uncharacterized protein n=1 Tax=Pterulicium gracile TaxID=1884261 RepID=A0A5C3Q2L3_9AGAR|nr:hypothetical protein BDV98DRAFT_597959 [Pterula gracilis]